jgi:hypothetical protein
MPTYIFTYRTTTEFAPTPETTAAWMAWFDGMGDQLVELGKPAIGATAIGNCRTGETELGGYSLVRADDLEAAVSVAKGCPQLDRNGGVEIAELGEVPDAVSGSGAA